MKLVSLSLCVFLLAGCSFFRTETKQETNTETNTVTHEVELREEIIDGKKYVLRTDRLTDTKSKETAEVISQKKTDFNLPDPAGLLSNVTTGNPIIDGGIALIMGFAGKKGYDKVRDASPRTPQKPTQAEVRVVRRKEDEEAT